MISIPARLSPTILHRIITLLAVILSASSISTVAEEDPGPPLGLVNGDRITLADQHGEAQNWLSHGRGYFEQRFSPLKKINTSNLAELELAWHFDTGNNKGLQATPLVVDGVMYITAAWSVVHALDATTGRELWRFDPEVPREESYRYCCGVINRGVAAWGELVFVGTLDGRLIAIDRETGEPSWAAQTTPSGENYTITGAPRVVKGKVIIGNGGAEYGVRGYVSAYNANTGELAWRFYTVPGNPEEGPENSVMAMAAKTWTGNWWELGGGGTVWDSMAYDPELDLLYIGVGNGSPHNRRLRSPDGGDNLFLCSIIALRPDTGEYVWHYQQIPAETWDYTATQHIILADLDWNGEQRKLLLQAPKAGFFYVLDRETGELLSAEPYARRVTWASHYDMETGRPQEIEGQDYADEEAFVHPIGLGAHNWHPMSFNPGTGLVYIPAQEAAGPLASPKEFSPTARHWNTGIDETATSDNAQLAQTFMQDFFGGYLLAWDPVEQRTAWEAQHSLIGNGGTLSTAGNLVFQGTVDGQFLAFDAATGEKLWQFDTQNGIVGSPVSYAVNDEQFVAVPAGRGGGLSLIIGVQHDNTNVNGRVLAFKRGGNASLPPVATKSIPAPPPRVAGISQAELDAGASHYSKFCARCHGIGVVSDGSIPDLRRLDAVWYDNFNAVVLEGMMEKAGMPRFDDVLDEQSAAQIYAYIVEQANQDHEQRTGNRYWYAIKQWFYNMLVSIAKWASYQ